MCSADAVYIVHVVMGIQIDRYRLNMLFLKFDLVYFYGLVGYLYVCVRGSCEYFPK